MWSIVIYLAKTYLVLGLCNGVPRVLKTSKVYPNHLSLPAPRTLKYDVSLLSLLDAQISLVVELPSFSFNFLILILYLKKK